MLAKLLALLSTAKGATAAGVIAAAAVGTGVTVTNHDVQNALSTALKNLAEQAEGSARPAVVTARNDADQKLRDAFQTDQQKLAKLHDTKVAISDREKLNDLLNTADQKLRDRMTKALNDVAALTLGREGQESPKPTGSPDVKTTFTPDMQIKVDAVVNAAITDLNKITSDAETAVAAFATVTPGKPEDAGHSADPAKPADAGKPSSVPSPRPTR